MNMAQNWVRRPDDGSSDLARSIIVLKLVQCLGLLESFLRGAGGHDGGCKTFEARTRRSRTVVR